MHVQWTHHYIPTVFGCLSFVVNLILAYLILTEPKTSTIGKYRFLILFFTLFDIFCTIVDLLVPVGIQGIGSAVVIYIDHGPFFGKEVCWNHWSNETVFQNIYLGEIGVSLRCTCISLSYGILITHFIYRYIALVHPRYVDGVFRPRGLILLFLYFPVMDWFGLSCAGYYIRDGFRDTSDVDSYELAFVAALYLIYSKIRTKDMSPMTRKLHKQLFIVLVVQTIIPIVFCLAPCFVFWFAPIFYLDLGMGYNYFSVIPVLHNRYTMQTLSTISPN
nr:protein R11G11.4 [imported] - Caenorhabditis elegans [Caenorhabditis elegans]